MKAKHGRYEIDDDIARIDFGRVRKWLSRTYWSPGIRRPEVEEAARNSTMVVAAYSGKNQVAYMRLVSDKVRFAYFMDVYVAPSHRGRGIARGMIRFALRHPDLKKVYQWLLATKDAQSVYAGIGFKLLPNPGSWMVIKKAKKWR